MDYINAFWVGGLICALTQILLDRTKLMPGRIMVLLVCSGSVLGAFKIYPVIQDLPEQEPVYRYWGLEISCGKV